MSAAGRGRLLHRITTRLQRRGPGCYSWEFERVRYPVASDPSNRTTAMIIRIATLLLLCSASLPLLAAEGRAAADGKGCPGVMAPDERDGASAGAQGGEAEAGSKDKASQPARGGNAENSVRGPRMHNLLPGMFR